MWSDWQYACLCLVFLFAILQACASFGTSNNKRPFLPSSLFALLPGTIITCSRDEGTSEASCSTVAGKYHGKNSNAMWSLHYNDWVHKRAHPFAPFIRQYGCLDANYNTENSDHVQRVSFIPQNKSSRWTLRMTENTFHSYRQHRIINGTLAAKF